MSRGTILFLDDDQELQSLVSAYLRERGYEVEPARTVKEARTVLACIRVDAAIVDGLLVHPFVPYDPWRGALHLASGRSDEALREATELLMLPLMLAPPMT